MQCHFDKEALRLTQVRTAGRFLTTVPNINLCLKATYAKGGRMAVNAGDVVTWRRPRLGHTLCTPPSRNPGKIIIPSSIRVLLVSALPAPNT